MITVKLEKVKIVVIGEAFLLAVRSTKHRFQVMNRENDFTGISNKWKHGTSDVEI